MLSSIKKRMLDLNPFSINNKKLLITGATSGIGKAMAIEFSNLGAQLILVGRNSDKLTTLIEELKNKGIHSSVNIDFSDINSIKEGIEKIPKIDGLIHSAGIVDVSPLAFQKDEAIFAMIDINLKGSIYITKCLLRQKKLLSNASLVFLSSINGLGIGVSGFVTYSSTKGAISSMVKSLAVELAPKYRVNCIAPGMVETPMKTYIQDVISSENIEKDKDSYPMKNYLSPSDIVNVAIFLLSSASRFITGTTLVVDGGRSIK